MPFDDDLATGLTALADRAHPRPGDPEGLLRLHTLQQRRRVAVRGSALMAVTATGAVLTLPHLGERPGPADLGTGSSPSPMISAASDCSGAPDPQPTPRAPTQAAPPANGPLPTPGPRTPPPMADQRIPLQIAAAVDSTAPTGVTRACDLGTDLIYRAGGADGTVIDVAAAAWTGPLPPDPQMPSTHVIRTYPDASTLRSHVTAKGTQIELWTQGDLITWGVEPSSTTPGARVEDLEAWADRVHSALH